MTLTLSPELEQLVEKKVKSGLYPTAGDVVREALRLLEERDRSVRLRHEVREGFNQIERGEYTEYDEHTIKDLAADIKDRGMKRLAGERMTPTGCVVRFGPQNVVYYLPRKTSIEISQIIHGARD